MFATSERVSPCSARWSPRSVGRLTISWPSSSATVMSWLTRSESVPFGPFTVTVPRPISTSTPEGTGMGFRPIRLIRSPDVAQHLAANALFLGLAAGDDAARGGQDCNAHAAQHLVGPVLAGVDAPTGLGDTLQARDHALAVGAVLERHHQRVVHLALAHRELLDVALLLEDARDLPAHAGARHLHLQVERLVGVADAGEHVCDRISDHGSPHQLLFVMPGTTPWWASSRRQIRHTPKRL